MASDPRRLSILTTEEISDLYSLPRFTEDDRRLYFDLSPIERDLIDNVHTISVAAHLILQLGYFKAMHQFFAYGREAVLMEWTPSFKTASMCPNGSGKSPKRKERPK